MFEHSCQFSSIEVALKFDQNQNEQISGPALLILPCKLPSDPQSQQLVWENQFCV
jgi:hypothetical protein